MQSGIVSRNDATRFVGRIEDGDAAMCWTNHQPGGGLEIKLTERPDTDPCTQAPVSWRNGDYAAHWHDQGDRRPCGSGWTEEARKRDLAMNSGAVGYDAVSTLYVTASYLWHATRIRLRIPSELKGRGINLLSCLYGVRANLGRLEFYGVAQDSTGASMT